MIEINGYSYYILEKHVLSRLKYFTRSNIEHRLSIMKERLEVAQNETVFISIGGNCGPAVKLRELDCLRIGACFFDNIVIETADFERLLNNNFEGILQLSNLAISSWEGNDSVLDRAYNILFHHYFYILEAEKFHGREDRRQRRIDEEDIPLFLSAVRSQFEYLQQKFSILCRSPHRKVFVLRQVGGEACSIAALDSIDRALVNHGAKNFALVNVYSFIPSGTIDTRHHYINEVSTRWGSSVEWADMIASLT